MKKFGMRIKPTKTDWKGKTAEQDGTAETGSWNTLKSSRMRVHHEEVINGKRYKVLTVG